MGGAREGGWVAGGGGRVEKVENERKEGAWCLVQASSAGRRTPDVPYHDGVRGSMASRLR